MFNNTGRPGLDLDHESEQQGHTLVGFLTLSIGLQPSWDYRAYRNAFNDQTWKLDQTFKYQTAGK